MLGYLFAAQLQDYVATHVLPAAKPRGVPVFHGVADPAEASFYGSTAAGAFLRERVFAPGNLKSWKEHVRAITGEELAAEPFARRCGAGG